MCGRSQQSLVRVSGGLSRCVLLSDGQYWDTDIVSVSGNVKVRNGYGCRFEMGGGGISILTVEVV